jgi:hypothetical protein
MGGLQRAVNHNKNRTLIQSHNQLLLYTELQMEYFRQIRAYVAISRGHKFDIRNFSRDFDEIWCRCVYNKTFGVDLIWNRICPK